MVLKKVIKNYPMIIILIVLLLVTLIGLFINKEEEPEIIEEEEVKIEVIPYKDYDWNNLSGENILRYEDDKYTSMFGIDVAAHQETIDWAKVKEEGVEFAYIRLGYRGASEGKLNTDLEFEKNYKGAIENGIKVGIYWYSQPISKEEAKQEAEYVIEVLNGRPLDLPIVYDFEETEFYDGTTSRIHGMTRQNRTTMAVTFLDTMKEYGYDCMIYTNLYWSKTYYDWSRLLDYPIWYAQYGANFPQYDRPLVMWQYTDSGIINGIDHLVDLDILFIRKNDQN